MATTKKTSQKKTVKKTTVKSAPVKKNDSVKYTNMFAAYSAFWRRGFTEWAGTSSRSEYWWSWLANVLVCFLLAVVFLLSVALDAALFQETAIFSTIMIVVAFAYIIAAIIPSLSMLTRRMHDAGLSAWFWLLYFTSFIPVIGSYIWSVSAFVIALLPTRTVDNPYHKNNK